MPEEGGSLRRMVRGLGAVILGVVVSLCMMQSVIPVQVAVSAGEVASQHSPPAQPMAPGKLVQHMLVATDADGVDPPPSTEIVKEFTNVCLPSRGGDRFGNPVPWDRSAPLDPGWGNLGDGPAFVVLDVCKMGHQPKDATLLHAVIQEQRAQNHPITPVVLFGNRCMARKKATKGTWHILKDWFDVSINITEQAEKSRIVYIEDHPKGVCVGRLQRRPHHESFRWLRTRWQADVFRRDFLAHFNVRVPVRKEVSVTLLRRGVERHFDEDVVWSHLRSWKPYNVRYVQFDSDGNPKGTGDGAERVVKYVDQLAVLATTDVLIAAHGAAFSSIVALPRGAAAIEAFPHNFRYHMYAELAQLFTITYYPIESREPWKNGKAHCSSCAQNNLREVLQPYHANGLKNCKTCTPPCKKCDIKLEWGRVWVPVLRSALHSVRNSLLGSFRRQVRDKHQWNDSLDAVHEELDE